MKTIFVKVTMVEAKVASIQRCCCYCFCCFWFLLLLLLALLLLLQLLLPINGGSGCCGLHFPFCHSYATATTMTTTTKITTPTKTTRLLQTFLPLCLQVCLCRGVREFGTANSRLQRQLPPAKRLNVVAANYCFSSFFFFIVL